MSDTKSAQKPDQRYVVRESEPIGIFDRERNAFAEYGIAWVAWETFDKLVDGRYTESNLTWREDAYVCPNCHRLDFGFHDAMVHQSTCYPVDYDRDRG